MVGFQWLRKENPLIKTLKFWVITKTAIHALAWRANHYTNWSYEFPSREEALSCKICHAPFTCLTSVNGAPTAKRRMYLPDKTCHQRKLMILLESKRKVHWSMRPVKHVYTVCVMKIFPVEFTESSRSRFSWLPSSSELGRGKSRKQTKEKVLGVTTCKKSLDLQIIWWGDEWKQKLPSKMISKKRRE